MKHAQRDGRDIEPMTAWYHVVVYAWIDVRVTRTRRIFGRQEYFITPVRGPGRWVSADALDFDPVVV